VSPLRASTSTARTTPYRLVTLVTRTLPKSISVTFSPSTSADASDSSSKQVLACQTAFSPTSLFFGCSGTFTVSVFWSVIVSGTIPVSSSAVCRGARGSMTPLFSAQILSHSIRASVLDAPCEMRNDWRASSVMPRRKIPRTVGNAGSDQSSTRPVLTNQRSCRFAMHVFWKARREKSSIWGHRMPQILAIWTYCGLRSLYSVVRSA